MPRPRINFAPVAGQYTSGSERIVEFNSGLNSGPGGLINFRREDDGTLRVEIYRTDPGTHVFVENRHTVYRGLTLSDGTELNATMAYAGNGRFATAYTADDRMAMTVNEDGTSKIHDGWTFTPTDRTMVKAFLCGLLGTRYRAED